MEAPAKLDWAKENASLAHDAGGIADIVVNIAVSSRLQELFDEDGAPDAEWHAVLDDLVERLRTATSAS